MVSARADGGVRKPTAHKEIRCLRNRLLAAEPLSKFAHEFILRENEVLGSGQSGKVSICYSKQSNNKCALKIISKVSSKHTKEELSIMANLDHPNIVRPLRLFESEDKLYLVLECCHGGELFGRWRNQSRSKFDEMRVCKYIHTILYAIKYCHTHNVAHNDVKLENIVFEDDSDEAELKLIDFGSSLYHNGEKMTKIGGTPTYFAPEVRYYECY
jgi:serine/threonine protein kinase